MSQIEPVGKFKFGGNHIEADSNGVFTINFASGGIWKFDLGEIVRLSDIVKKILEKQIKPTKKDPEIFWRTNGSKVIDIYIVGTDVHIREGGQKEAYFWISEIEELLRLIKILTVGAPYHRLVRLLDIDEEDREQHILRIDRFPINNRNSATSTKVEKELSQEITKTISIETSFGIGIDYWIATSLESKFGITGQQKISETSKVTMEAAPGEHIEYVVTWKEETTCGNALFEINGARHKIPFRLKSGLIPEIKHNLIARDNK